MYADQGIPQGGMCDIPILQKSHLLKIPILVDRVYLGKTVATSMTSYTMVVNTLSENIIRTVLHFWHKTCF